eukprot:tig00020909_g15353.t1
MAYLLPHLRTKKEVDNVIRNTRDKVVVLRFGRASDLVCMQHDEILAKTQNDLANMAVIYLADVDEQPVYTKYFDITIVPATVFFWNAQHMKVDYGTQDHTKWIGAFFEKQDFIDLVEVIYRGGIHNKQIVTSPIDSRHVPKYNLIYKDI